MTMISSVSRFMLPLAPRCGGRSHGYLMLELQRRLLTHRSCRTISIRLVV